MTSLFFYDSSEIQKGFSIAILVTRLNRYLVHILTQISVHKESQRSMCTYVAHTNT